MIDWFFATLRQYPEIAIFLTLAIGFYFGKFKFKGIGLGAVTATLLAGVLIGQIGITDLAAAQGLGLPAVPVRRRLRRRAAVRARRREGRPAAGAVLGGAVRVLPRGAGRHRQDGGLRPRLRGGPLLRVADDLRRDGPLDRRDQPRWASTRSRPRPCSTRCRSPTR